jgi:hypothetical protein
MLLIALMVLGFVPSPASAADYTPEQLQKWWVAEIDDTHRAEGAALLPYPNTDVTRRMAHTIIEGLWDSPDYRNELKAWLQSRGRIYRTTSWPSGALTYKANWTTVSIASCQMTSPA